ncbi:hypothetical protein POTOM_008746 [Populus tomentosa]|uniref:CCHC-type domain-containing protein n=1 Tax=Populus tomentosa TaxID=118781 RepID=A0A8X8DCJ5_POPTO|nr:hypothetical protein POTOM_008746 [Populus tomentosa]
MEKLDISQPITTVLSGLNYNLWIQGMKSFLIGRKLWRILTGDITKPTKETDESDMKFADRLEDWDSKNHQIITRFRNTSVPAIHIHLKQGSGQSVNDFLAQVQPIWNQISQASISGDHLHLIQEIIFEETRLNLDKSPQFDIALATTRSPHHKFGNQTCKNCHKMGHVFATCPTVECRYCHAFGHILEHCPTRPPRPKGGFSKSKIMSKPGFSSVTVAATTEGSTFVTMSDLEAMVKQAISSNSSTAMSATPDNSSWFFYSACCNHMATDINLLSSKIHVSSLPPIYTANGTQMTVTHTGHATTPNLSLLETYHIPNLTLNLISVCQLCETT